MAGTSTDTAACRRVFFLYRFRLWWVLVTLIFYICTLVLRYGCCFGSGSAKIYLRSLRSGTAVTFFTYRLKLTAFSGIRIIKIVWSRFARSLIGKLFFKTRYFLCSCGRLPGSAQSNSSDLAWLDRLSELFKYVLILLLGIGCCRDPLDQNHRISLG
jgi:hypothetical protein